MGKSRATQDEQKEKLGEVLLDEDIYAGLCGLINDYKEEFLKAIDAAPEQKLLYQFVGERRACTNILIRLECLRNKPEEE